MKATEEAVFVVGHVDVVVVVVAFVGVGACDGAFAGAVAVVAVVIGVVLVVFAPTLVVPRVVVEFDPVPCAFAYRAP